MKAIYAKPMLTVEYFAPTQSMTRDCSDSIPDSQVTLNDISTCVWELGGGTTVFISKPACDINGDQMGYVCYNNPSEGNYIFRS